MLETYNIIILNSFRNFKKNIKSSPGLYFIFFFMSIFTSFFIGFLTILFIRNEIDLDINNVFFVIFFLFLIKSTHDFYIYFTKSKPITYVLSTQVSHWKTIFEVFFGVFWIQLGIWVFFSSLYTISLVLAGQNLSYPLLYLKFTFGIILSSIIGTIITIHYFSNNKYRLIPVAIIIYLLYQYNDLSSIILILFLSILYLFLSLRYSLDSFQYIIRKKRKKEKTQLWQSNILKAIFYKELIILWREKVLFSLLFSSVIIGIGTGYLARFGTEEILPESLQFFASMINPESYAFFGIYVLTIHGAVFISLSLFLNEDNTIWLIRNIPVKMNKIVIGKAFLLTMPFLCSIPFIAYYSAFTNGESIIYLFWLLIFSYLASIIICFPLGARYVGKKSDIMLMYSISLIIFIVLAFAFSFNMLFYIDRFLKILFFLITILIELILVYISIEVTAKSLSVKYKN